MEANIQLQSELGWFFWAPPKPGRVPGKKRPVHDSNLGKWTLHSGQLNLTCICPMGKCFWNLSVNPCTYIYCDDPTTPLGASVFFAALLSLCRFQVVGGSSSWWDTWAGVVLFKAHPSADLGWLLLMQPLLLFYLFDTHSHTCLHYWLLTFIYMFGCLYSWFGINVS